VIGRIGGRAVACGAIRAFADDTAEIKRMYVVPECRGRGFSKVVLAELERLARESGYAKVRLETGVRQPEAIALYERSGYQRIRSERNVHFEKELQPAAGR
jgi:putative acetyltransferase